MAIVPVPKFDVSIRVATLADVDFMDSLQKRHNKALGWFPRKQFEGYVGMGGVLVAECVGERVGYVISRDRYAGRDDVGAIYQVAVEPGRQRGLVGAALVKAVFERAAYGCRLFCCWCAQDLPANYFWESLGFVPVAFRTGSRSRGKGGMPRTHILWQRHVREGDGGGWWYPFQTTNGAIREDRLVFPIAPGVPWQEAKPIVLPEAARAPEGVVEDRKRLPGPRKAKAQKPPEPERPKMAMIVGGRIKWVDRPAPAITAPKSALGETERRRDEETKCEQPTLPARVAPALPVEKAKREPRKMARHEAAALAFCRELRDRWMERVAEEPWMLEASGKYEVARALPGAPGGKPPAALPAPGPRQLPAAA